MSHHAFSAADLMDLLCRKVGLPADRRTEDLDVYFTDLDLDSLAFLQVQGELKKLFGTEMPDDSPTNYTVGDIVATVRAGRTPAVAS